MVPAGPEEAEDNNSTVGDDKTIQREVNAPNSEGAVTWQNIALSIGAELLFKVRSEILQNLGYTTSAVSLQLDEQRASG